MERGLPLCLLHLVIFWHLNMSCKVKWGDALSGEFPIPLRTKQGGISSPKFFALYVDEIADKLRKSGLGCHLVNVLVGAILLGSGPDRGRCTMKLAPVLAWVLHFLRWVLGATARIRITY